MADSKISALPASTVPLAGTEVLPIVQSSTTKQVSVANLTAGRAISALSVTATGLTSGRVTYASTGGLLADSSTLVYDTSGNFGVGTASPSSYGRLVCLNTAGGAYAIAAVGNDQSNVRIRTKNIGGGGGDFTIVGGNPGISNAGLAIFDETAAATRLYIDSSGSVSVAGALSKGSGSFRIDHPLPQLEETHQLVHSFIEGPQADLIYRGKANLVNGIASINIDTASTMTEGTFVALCRDVQCFTTNESGWNHVRGSVIGNVLTIECQDQTASDLISWMVIGERQDKHMMNTEWTDDNGRVIVEPIKVVETYAGIIKD
jgi:hypothetical protein